MVRPLVAGNWKMNGLRSALEEINQIVSSLPADNAALKADVMICPPATLIADMVRLADGSPLAIGAQDCHANKSGANTGDISAEMFADAGACAVIVGHSERRADHGELDRMVREKAVAAHRAGLTAIVCVGETEGQRQSGLTLDVVGRQLTQSVPDAAKAENLVVAYEPVWAIGSGLTPTEEDVALVHAFIRTRLEERFGEAEGGAVRILYGGSVKPSNAGALMAVENVNGALVGGASLKANDFLGILAAYE